MFYLKQNQTPAREREESLMPEVPHAGEQHGETGFVGRGDHFIIPNRTAGLDHCGGASLDRGQQAVGEWEEGV
jgi:hypothetical protein